MAPRTEHTRARRVYGQNLLTDTAAVRQVAAAAGLAAADLVVEVGAGRGSLTTELLRHARRVIAYEVDPAMAARLEPRPGLTVRAADFLAAEPPPVPFAVVGNIPYALTSAVVDWCLTAERLTAATLLTQLEYARKRSGDYGRWSRLTISTWPRYEWMLAGRIPRSAFRPVPGVDGGLLRIVRRPVPLVEPPAWEAYQRFVELGFRGVGGSLHASLSRRFEAARVAGAFRALRLAPATPVGMVWPEQWLSLFRLLNRRSARAGRR
ncbi:ErmE/ErmH/ErmO/ErmR family 23S rRNA (adenine(2058)-N(6))-methyltransferase [Dactylosporangium sp. AC04546]|uniref:ErmE/ErmH/ErmO/ErmR family 23S rRNA (adenine(2058)-N(6))-methyltransferase n=1 Tax=Dactylosporangium sp. AC04546 TaxID=2862460 RepID=UPI001EDDE68D|nr:ErmE/ErmH/ErmO/ErmR family 23S rRNA (adenine(2058)-N(6))-methyltransferase [Dactylosporangium sp. AC04546]WVK79877.1 ErmE/ErmH/ErmO/ErmR family 23S rRNA (adenine(2058)-N(6))-methyltransferase [Dactylosporangium sp. AC04546]